FLAATALHRLTTQTHGRAPNEWREQWSACAETHTLWQSWWENNRLRYPSPFTRQPIRKSKS
ncbi:MAG TPA: hypothetical protein VK137_09835, partial [Planctomycetaceae bacterium]|nr:hypothetical protein [Planctomycetaceae bacterium]